MLSVRLLFIEDDHDSHPEEDLHRLSLFVSPLCCDINTGGSTGATLILRHTNRGTSPAFESVLCLSLFIIYGGKKKVNVRECGVL